MQPFVAVRVLKFRLWVERVGGSRQQQTTLVYAGLVGLLGGLSGALFRKLINALLWLFTAHEGGLVAVARELSSGRRMAVPMVGATLAGSVLWLGNRLSHGRRAADFMEAIVLSDGVIFCRPVLVRCASSLLSIASGGSMGREGPIVQLAAMLASSLGRALRLPAPRLRLLVACGVAAGIASAYKAPIAASLFVAEVVLGSIAMESFGPLVFAAVVAALTTRQLGSKVPLYAYAGQALHSNGEIAAYLLVGLAAGVGGPCLLALLRLSERSFARAFAFLPLRFLVGGTVVGGLSLWVPEVWGNGYSVVNRLLVDDFSAATLWTWLGCKVLATAAVIGSGAVGGVFTPTLLVGALVGALCAKLYHLLFLSYQFDPSSYVAVGMGSFLAATTHAPLMAILMVFELTLDYDLVMPLMLSSVVAYYTACSLDGRNIYTPAAKSGPAAGGARRPESVADLLQHDFQTVTQTASFLAVARAFAVGEATEIFVVDAQQRYCGVIFLPDIRSYLDDPTLAQLVTAYDIMEGKVPALQPSQSLLEAVGAFARFPGERLPVVRGAADPLLVGSLAKADVLLTLAHGAPPSGWVAAARGAS